MTPARVLTFAEDVPAAALSSLAANGAAAWLIDIAGGRICAANTAGSAVLGLDCSGSQPLLDASMPALVCLRVLARETSRDAALPARLVFWSRDGAVRLQCRVDILGTWPQALALVTALGSPDGKPPAEGASSAAPACAGSDAVKLKEIARRIREGQVTRLQPALRRQQQGIGSPDAPDEADRTPAPDAPFSIRASLAHELKTPLSAIAAAAEIMQDERFGPLGSSRYVGYARDIHGSAQHVLGVIDRMLAEGRTEPEALSRDLDVTEIDLGETLAATVSQLAPLAERAGIALALELSPRLPHVIADVTSLRQIVLNLVTNALKFTGRGGRIAVAARYDGDGPLSISVSDTGPGMTDEEIAKLLAPDGAARPQRSGGQASTDGLGLGLPLVRALAGANGAELCIESRPGEGTSASIVFGKGRVVPV